MKQISIATAISLLLLQGCLSNPPAEVAAPAPISTIMPEVDHSGDAPDCETAAQRIADNVAVGIPMREVQRLVGKPAYKLPGYWLWSDGFNRSGKPFVMYDAIGSTLDDPPVSEGSSTSFVSNDAAGGESALRELVYSSQTTERESIVQCFCDSLYRSTLLMYHFVDQQAVLTMEFDNTASDFPAAAEVHLFEQTVPVEHIERWINNQYSDGLYLSPATPTRSIELNDPGITITSSVFEESREGNAGDSYDKYGIEFSVDNYLEQGAFMLNGFSDQADVYFQTSPVTRN